MSKEKVIAEMENIFKEVPYGIEHTFNVLRDAETIIAGEDVKDEVRDLITITAILHDIGTVEAQRKYGSMDAVYQEKEGAIIAEKILSDLNYGRKFIERVCFIIRHHHTPSMIDGIDFQIQWESDLLVNLENMDIKNDKEKLQDFIEDNFKTSTGRSIALARFMQC